MKTDENAVSPVIGVILMVAITVVLATMVFVLVQRLSTQEEATPKLSFEKEADYLRVIQAPTGLDWDAFTVVGCETVPTGPVDAGDKIETCAGEVTISHTATNGLVYSTTF